MPRMNKWKYCLYTYEYYTKNITDDSINQLLPRVMNKYYKCTNEIRNDGVSQYIHTIL